MTHKPPPGLTEDDFDAIEDAVMETARGRWFLREFARRARAADTNKLLEALSRIEQAVAGQGALGHSFSPAHHAQALDERHSRFAEIAWALRERGYDGAICTLLENEARALARLAETMRGSGPLVDADTYGALPAPAARQPEAEPAPKMQTPPVAPSPQATPAVLALRPAPIVRDDRLAALAVIDQLGAREKAALFA